MARFAHVGRAFLGVAISLTAIFIVGTSWWASNRSIHLQHALYDRQSMGYGDLHPETLSVTTSDGLHLTGWFFQGRSTKTIVLSHCYGDNQATLLPWAEFLHRAGFTVFSYDLRGHGFSDGNTVTFGVKEAGDLSRVVDMLSRRKDVDAKRIGALGVSLGAATTIIAAAHDPRIKAVVDDSSYSDLQSVVDHSFQRVVGIPSFPFGPLTIKFAELQTGVNMAEIRPIDEIALIAPRPVFVIHGLADSLVPVSDGKRLFAAAREPKTGWFVAGVDHAKTREAEGAEYTRRVVGFFEKALDGK